VTPAAPGEAPAGVAAPPLPPPPPPPPWPERASKLLEALGLFFAIGASTGLLFWTLINWAVVPIQATTNRLDVTERLAMFVTMGLSAALFTAVASVYLLRIRRVGHDGLHRTALRLSPLLIAGLVPLCFHWGVWAGRELEGLLLILVTSLGLERALRTALDGWEGAAPSVLDRIPRWAPLAVVASAAAAYAVFFAVFTIRNHYRFATSAYDLGIENNLVWNAAHLNGPLFKTSPLGGPTSTHFGFHQTFISYLIAIPYRLWPTPQALLALQAAVIGLAAVPLFLWLKKRLSPWLAALVTLAYLFYPPLHGSNLYDFHYQPFGPLFLFTTLLCFEAGRWRWAALLSVLTMSVREDMSLMLAVLGAFLVLSRQRILPGLILTAVCGVVFVVQKLIIMPTGLNGFPAYVNQYQGLVAPGDQVTYGSVLKTVFTNPGFTFLSLMDQPRLVYALHIFVPLVLLPLRRPLGWLLCLPGMFFTLLATQYPPLLSIHFQYTAYWSMFVFLAVGWVLAHSIAPRRAAAAAALALATAATTINYGGWVRPEGVRGAWDEHHFNLTEQDHRRHADAYALINRIPPDAKVAASERLNPHVSSRQEAYTLRGTAFDADYMLFEQSALRGDERDALRPLAQRKEVGVVETRGGFWLLKRGADPARNEELLAVLQ
jgi:uncharacterized membrane protein